MIFANTFSDRIPDWLGWLLIAFNLLVPYLLVRFTRKKLKHKAVFLLFPAYFSISFFISVLALVFWVGLTGSHEIKPKVTEPVKKTDSAITSEANNKTDSTSNDKIGAKPASTELKK